MRSKMDNRGNNKRGKLNNNILLLAVLLAFCVLALIEIVYGQARMKVEKERLALEQQNQQTVQEIQEEWNRLKDSAGVTTGELTNSEAGSNNTQQTTDTTQTVENTAAESSTQQETTQPQQEERQYDMQIVFMGDSILDNDREDGGVASLISDKCNAKVYNMAMGGTTAALLPNEKYSYDEWESRSLLGVVNAIVGNISGDIFQGYRAGEILNECDFSKTDYFVIEYGVNDFLSRQIPQSIYQADGSTLSIDRFHTYCGALETAVSLLQNKFPNAKIMLIAPHYCQIYDAGNFMGDGYSVNYGYGTLVEFSRIAGYVYEENKDKNVIFYNAFEESGIDAETASKYLEDGVHLSDEGRQVYADYAARLILADFNPEE